MIIAQNTTGIIPLWYKIMPDGESQVWRGSDLDHYWHFIAVFLRRMTEDTNLTGPCVVSPHGHLITARTPYHKKSPNLGQWVVRCGDVTVKSRVHAAAK